LHCKKGNEKHRDKLRIASLTGWKSEKCILESLSSGPVTLTTACQEYANGVSFCCLGKGMQNITFVFYLLIYPSSTAFVSIPVGAPSKARVCGHSLFGIAGSSNAGGVGCLHFVSVVCSQEEVFASACSFFQRNITNCGVSECDREASIMRRPLPTRGCCDIKKLLH